jgi:adenylate cyclase
MEIEHHLMLCTEEGNGASLPIEWVTKTGDDLRKVSEALINISRQLHEHTQKLEIAVEGRYASESGDPRVQLLTDALHVSRMSDLQLSRMSMELARITKVWREQAEHIVLQRTSENAQSLTFQSRDHSTVSIKAEENSNQIPNTSHQRFVTTSDTHKGEREKLTSNITSLQQERDELGTLYEIARVLNSTLEFEKVLRLVMDRVIQFVNAERGFLMLIHLGSDEPEFAIARDKFSQPIAESVFATASISRNTVKRVIRTREPVLTDDTQTDISLREQESILAYHIRSIMCAPLIVRNRCIGAVYVDSRFTTTSFEPRHRELLLAFCNQAAIAIENARLFNDLSTAIKRVREDKQYMDNIFGSIVNGVVTTDSIGTITTFNAAAGMILSLAPQQIMGLHYTQAFKSRPQVGLVELLTRAYLQHEHGTIVDQTIECTVPGREGIISLSCYVSSLRDTQGAHIGMALVINDQTSIKQSQAEKERFEAQAKRVRHIFEQYVHPNVVQQLMQNPSALHLGGETKEISVVFADIRGYTRLSENLPPGEVMNLINRYLKIMCDAIWEEEGTLTAFLGDALMAIFNAPLPQREHPLHAVRAAWKMRAAVFNYQRSQPRTENISFGFGVNTGLATVGNVGARERLQNYTAIGDVINIAARLQNSATDNDIYLNNTTYDRVQHHVRVDPPFKLHVKNKTVPLTVHRLLGLL